MSEPLNYVAYLYDGTLDGFFCAVFQSYARREFPQDITTKESYQPRFLQSEIEITTDETIAFRVKQGIVKALGSSGFSAVVHAFAADSASKERILLRFIRQAMRRYRKTGMLWRFSLEEADPLVNKVLKLVGRTRNEAEKMRQFIRFSKCENGIWYSKCNPNCSVIPLVMPHFAARFNIQPFLIYDENHMLAGVYDGTDWYLINDELATIPRKASEDAFAEVLWQHFYDSVSIDARYNPELRRNFMPVRLWKNLPEMQPRIPGCQLRQN